MGRPNYTFAKRQKELAKKKKKEEKRLKKLAATAGNDQSKSNNNTPNINSPTSDLDVWQFLDSHLEAVTSIWDSNNFTETK